MKRVLLAALLLSACSGGDGETTGVSKADFIAAAETICAQANTDQDALKTPTSVAALAPYVARIVEIAETATSELKELELPAADATDLKTKVLDPLQAQLTAGLAYADSVKAAADKNDFGALTTLLGDPPTDSQADLRWMKDYGFDACVKAADTTG